MKKKFVVFNTFVVFIALVLMAVLSVLNTKDTTMKMAADKVQDITKICSKTYDSSNPKELKNIPDDIRVTIIAKDGAVVHDTHIDNVKAMGNQKQRPEVKAAIEGKPKVVVKYDSSIKRNVVYYAEKKEVSKDDWIYIRTSLPVVNMNSYLTKSVFITISVFVFIVIGTFIVTILLSDNMLKPLEVVKSNLSRVVAGEHIEVMPTTDDVEINKMLSDINDVSLQIKNGLTEIANKNERLDSILSNVSDGVIVINKNKEIIHLNNRARDIFDLIAWQNQPISILGNDLKFINLLEYSIEKKENITQNLVINGKDYLCTLRNTEEGMLIAVLADVTAVKHNEKMRSEFFANASHELKTPTTSIKGFNEMIMLCAKEPKVKKYAEHINQETDRIINLVNDMLHLSSLEYKIQIDKEKIDLNDIVDEVLASLEVLIKSKKIKIKISGKANVFMEKAHAFELLKNLIENAIRYNNEKGAVEVDLEEQEQNNKVIITVKDNGMGLDQKHHERIFERFYRTDEGRTRESGGTGLGLAIVKHVTNLYKGHIDFKSKVGVGTEIKVTLPKE